MGSTAARPVESAPPTTTFYGWRVVAAAFAVLFVAYGLQFSFGVFVNEITDDTGWSRADILLPYAVYVALYSWLSSVSGWATDRYGPRRVVAVGAVILGIGWAGFGLSHALWQVYLTLGLAAAIGMSATWVPCNATVVRWFVLRRGTAVGVASSGGATGNLVVPPLAAGLIALLGWRATIPALAIVGTVTMLACSRFMVRDPEELGLHPKRRSWMLAIASIASDPTVGRGDPRRSDLRRRSDFGPGRPAPAVGSQTESMTKWRRWTDPPFMALAIGSLPLLLLEFRRQDLTESDRLILDVVNIVVLVAFTTDYLVELSLASSRREYIRGEWLNGLVVATSAVAIVPRLALFGGTRVVRGLPALRGLMAITRAILLGGSAARDGRGLIGRRAVTFAVSIAAFVWLTAAVAFTLAEDVGEDGRVESFVDALWWSAATITTVGYGDVTPITAGGRLAGLVAMVVGISTFAVITARVAAFLVVPEEKAPDTETRSI